jgi:hypothetical protein
MNIPRNWKKIAGGLFIAGALAFLIFSTLAMLFYTGGNSFYPDSGKYSFFLNFISDLGMETTFDGNSNLFSQILFGIGVFITGLSLFLFVWILFLGIIKTTKISLIKKIVSVIALLLGIMASIGYIGIAFTPWDVLSSAHMISVYLGFYSTPLMAFTFIFVFLKTKDLPQKAILPFFLLFIWVNLYIGTMWFGPSGSTELVRNFHAISQKAAVYGEIIGLIWIGIIFWKHPISQLEEL